MGGTATPSRGPESSPPARGAAPRWAVGIAAFLGIAVPAGLLLLTLRGRSRAPVPSWTLFDLEDQVRPEEAMRIRDRLDLDTRAVGTRLGPGWAESCSQARWEPGRYAWISRRVAKLDWPLAEPAELVLRIRAKAHDFRNWKQTMRIRWNDREVGIAELAGTPRVFSFPVPAEATRGGMNRLRFEMAFTSYPDRSWSHEIDMGRHPVPERESGWSADTVNLQGTAWRWLEGSRGTIRFHAPRWVGAASLALGAIGVPAPAGPRTMRLGLNGSEVASFPLSGPPYRTIPLPGGVLREGENRLDITVEPGLPEEGRRGGTRGPAAISLVRIRGSRPVTTSPRLAAGVDWIEVDRIDADRGTSFPSRPVPLPSMAPVAQTPDGALLVLANTAFRVPFEDLPGSRLQGWARVLGREGGRVHIRLLKGGGHETSPRVVLDETWTAGDAHRLDVSLDDTPGGTPGGGDGPDGGAGELTWLVVSEAKTPLLLQLFGVRVRVAGSSPPPRPNVFFLVMDTLRADHLSAYGYGRETSPRLSSLADRAVVFDRAYSTSTWTLPSMMSLFTGVHHGRLEAPREGPPAPGARDTLPRYRLVEQADTLAERLRRWGYGTAAFVDVDFLSVAMGFAQGFDRFDDEAARVDKKDWLHGTSLNLQKALTWARAEGDRPFFAFVHGFDVHGPYLPPTAYRRFFTSGSPGTGDPPVPIGEANNVFAAIPKYIAEGGSRSLAHYVRQYDREIRYVDDLIGSFLERLRTLGLLESSLVVLTADHGEAFGEGEAYCRHGTLSESTVHIPLFWFPPGPATRGRRVHALVQSVDVAASILQAATGRIPNRLDGRSFLSVVDGSGEEIRDAAILTGGWCWQQAMIEGPWKLVRFAPGLESVDEARETHPLRDDEHPERVHLRLYDLREDRVESADVSGSHGELTRAMLSRLDAWLRQAEEDRRRLRGEASPEVGIDEEVLERLRAVGYLGEGR